MQLFRQVVMCALTAAALLAAGSAQAVTVRVDYSLDAGSFGNKFFSSMNPQGDAGAAAARNALDAAAAFYSNKLEDTLAPIQIPPDLHSTWGGTAKWSWTYSISDPKTGLQSSNPGPNIPADEYTIIVGARNLPGDELGRGGPGGGGWSHTESGNFSPAETAYIAQTTAQFESAVEMRGETSGFARWGGSITFDTLGSKPWHFDLTTPPAENENDFYSVALHEIGHVLGFGASAQWDGFLNGATFVGPQAMAQYFQNGPVPVIVGGPEGGHWSAANTGSTVYGGTASQQSIMVPALPSGIRRQLTNLDAGALVDLGWEIDLPPIVPGDYNRNGRVDAADYTIWRNTLGLTSDLRANGNNTGASAGKIDLADYNFWKSRFGSTTPGSGSAALATSESASVPEPASGLLLTTAAVLIASSRRRLRPVNLRIKRLATAQGANSPG